MKMNKEKKKIKNKMNKHKNERQNEKDINSSKSLKNSSLFIYFFPKKRIVARASEANHAWGRGRIGGRIKISRENRGSGATYRFREDKPFENDIFGALLIVNFSLFFSKLASQVAPSNMSVRVLRNCDVI